MKSRKTENNRYEKSFLPFFLTIALFFNRCGEKLQTISSNRISYLPEGEIAEGISPVYSFAIFPNERKQVVFSSPDSASTPLELEVVVRPSDLSNFDGWILHINGREICFILGPGENESLWSYLMETRAGSLYCRWQEGTNSAQLSIVQSAVQQEYYPEVSIEYRPVDIFQDLSIQPSQNILVQPPDPVGR